MPLLRVPVQRIALSRPQRLRTTVQWLLRLQQICLSGAWMLPPHFC
jgi:hypothetical protein